MPGTPGNPIITQEWQAAILFAVGIGVVFLIHRYILRKIARDRRRASDTEE